MLQCSKEAFACCPTSHLCGSREESTFVEGSECDKFNQNVEKALPFDCPVCGHKRSLPATNADKIRTMSDEELADFINNHDICEIRTNEECKISYCGVCSQCVLDWLRQPADWPSEFLPDEEKQHSRLVEEE